MIINVLSDRFIVDDLTFSSAAPTSAQIRAMFGAPREEPIPLHGGGLRTRCVIDSCGVVFYRDDSPPEVPTIFIAFSAEDTPGHPDHSFPGQFLLGGTPIDHDTTEAKLPKNDHLLLRSPSPHTWHFRSHAFDLYLQFARARNRIGQRRGVHRLAYASLDFPSTNVA